MKKILSLIAVALLGITTTFAQTAGTVPVSKKKTKATTVKMAPVKVTKVEAKPATAKTVTPVVAKKEIKKPVVVATAKGAKLKKDGTADMRYKENKAGKAVVAGPRKKDGTADMRYKSNKPAPKKKAKS